MHVTIEAEPRGGLRLVKDLPIFRLGRLEGLNGIGKSAAIRLLQVCVGQQPYLDREQSLWTSFKTGVGEGCVVRISGLADGSTMEWILDPRRWPELSSERISSVGKITLNGQETELARVRHLLRIERVVGNEGLVPTIVRQLEPRHAAINDSYGPDSVAHERQVAVDAHLLRLESDLGETLAADVKALHKIFLETAIKLNRAESECSAAQNRVSQLTEVVERIHQLADVKGQSGDLDYQLQNLVSEMETANARLHKLDREVADAGKRQGAGPAAIKELELAQRNLARNNEYVVQAMRQCRAAAAAVGIEDLDPLLIDVPRQIANTAAQLRVLRESLSFVYSAPRVAEVAERLVRVLAEAEQAGLGEQLIEIEANSAAVFTIAGLRDRFSRVAQQLRRTEPPEEASRIQAELGELERRRRLLDSLGDVQAETSRRVALASRATDRLTLASQAVTSLSGPRFSELVSEREATTEQLRQLAVQRAEIVRARAELGGGLSEDVLRDLVAQGLVSLGSTAEGVEQDLRQAEATVGELEQRLGVATNTAKDARDAEANARRIVAGALRRLRLDEEFAWARRSVPEIGDDFSSLEQAQDALRPVLISVQRARERSERASRLPGQVTAALAALESRLSVQGGSAHESGTDLVVAATSWFGDIVSEWFQQPQIRTTLFAGAGEVRFDLADMTVNWMVEAEPFTRPLTAFSSGEQAFAYTRAQLEIIDSGDFVPNQIIALDEFGAFISREWLYRLDSYLRERVTTHPADHVLHVLPLTQTEDELSAAADVDKLASVQSQGYFVTRLSDE